ncbi:tyrosine-type recombinase/integrase [Suttonella ornithocola]|uniref:Tyrosine recombinase XerC n=2 Tax=Suttonella ornithocola TaxID=279832 RepID=A0A380MYA4_9GAMM|nr:site-specific integrase [Suttonella ornithocola]SUO96427.1 Tyrosine recombinase XerC [Suttonella ornithocola]
MAILFIMDKENLTPQTAPRHRMNAAERYIASLTAKSGKITTRSKLNNIAHLLAQKTLETFDWTSLSPDDLEYIKNLLVEKEYTPNTINNYLAIMRGTAKQAWLNEQISHEQYLLIQSVKNIRGKRISAGRALEVSEIHRFYDEVTTKEPSLMHTRDMALFALLVECGMRRAEVASLSCGSIFWEEGAIKAQTKGNKERLIFLSETSMSLLRQFFKIHPFKQHPDAPLFFRMRKNDTPVNTRLNDRSINKILDRHRIAAGLKRFTPHDLRRTFATYLFDMGIDAKQVQDAMGHENVATTVKYDRRKERRTREMMQNFRYKTSNSS